MKIAAVLARYEPKNLSLAVMGLADISNLVVNGNFSSWFSDNPVGWNVFGESAPDPEVSEVGASEGHLGSGNGMCNIYTSVGDAIGLWQSLTFVVGREYRFLVNVKKVTAGQISVYSSVPTDVWISKTYSEIGVKTFVFEALSTTLSLFITRKTGAGLCDVTIDDVSVKLTDVTQQVYDRPCWLFSLSCPNPNSYEGEVFLYNGFSESDDLVFRVEVPAFRTRSRILSKPLFFSKGLRVKSTIGMRPTLQYLVD